MYKEWERTNRTCTNSYEYRSGSIWKKKAIGNPGSTSRGKFDWQNYDFFFLLLSLFRLPSLQWAGTVSVPVPGVPSLPWSDSWWKVCECLLPRWHRLSPVFTYCAMLITWLSAGYRWADRLGHWLTPGGIVPSAGVTVLSAPILPIPPFMRIQSQTVISAYLISLEHLINSGITAGSPSHTGNTQKPEPSWAQLIMLTLTASWRAVHLDG